MPRLLACVLSAVFLALPASGPAASSASPAEDPALSVPAADLDRALECPEEFVHPEREPVLLVHGTVTTGHENFGWNWELLLPERGFDYCLVTYPDRGLGDMQVSAEYVVHAVRTIHERTGRKVDMMGHSQGGTMPRWAIKWWPSVRDLVDDFVMLGAPNHGVAYAERVEDWPFGMSAVAYQFDPGSEFLAALNAGDETPGDVAYSSLYSSLDFVVQPSQPVPTAALDWQREEANTRNIDVAALCPGRYVDHDTIGTTDRLSQELALDALVHPGPFDPARLDLGPLCALPDQFMHPGQLPFVLEQFQRSFSGGFADMHTTDREPELKPYARGWRDQEAAAAAETQDEEEPRTDESPESEDPAVLGQTLPATGPAVPTLPAAAGGTAALALALARLRRRLDAGA